MYLFQFRRLPLLNENLLRSLSCGQRIIIIHLITEKKAIICLIQLSVLNTRKLAGFAVTGQTFYAEWKRRLFKWKHGDSEWTDTGLIDDSEPLKGFDRGFKLAVSGDTVYVGKRDGKTLSVA